MNTTGVVIGRSGRKILKTLSPFATLLLDLSSALCEEEVSKLRLALLVDKHVTKRKYSELKNGADVLSHLHQNDLISTTDTQLMEHLLVKSGRTDLVNKITKYHKNRQKEENDQTAVKGHYERETRSGHASPTEFTALKELKTCPNTEMRSFGDGSSSVGNKHTKVDEPYHLESSPMVVDENSQEHLKLSQMSISDEEKERIGHKMTLFDNDVVLGSQ